MHLSLERMAFSCVQRQQKIALILYCPLQALLLPTASIQMLSQHWKPSFQGTESLQVLSLTMGHNMQEFSVSYKFSLVSWQVSFEYEWAVYRHVVVSRYWIDTVPVCTYLYTSSYQKADNNYTMCKMITDILVWSFKPALPFLPRLQTSSEIFIIIIQQNGGTHSFYSPCSKSLPLLRCLSNEQKASKSSLK